MKPTIVDKSDSNSIKMSQVFKNIASKEKKMHKGHVSVLEELNLLVKWCIQYFLNRQHFLYQDFHRTMFVFLACKYHLYCLQPLSGNSLNFATLVNLHINHAFQTFSPIHPTKFSCSRVSVTTFIILVFSSASALT